MKTLIQERQTTKNQLSPIALASNLDRYANLFDEKEVKQKIKAEDLRSLAKDLELNTIPEEDLGPRWGWHLG